jgi:hypothetical protein
MKWNKFQTVIDLISPVGNTNQKGQTQTSGYTRGGVRYLGGVSVSCRQVTTAMSPFSGSDKRHIVTITSLLT